MSMEAPIAELVEALRALPGVGPKSAQRMTYHLLERNREGGRRLARALLEAVEKIGHCARCRTFTAEEVCRLCASPRRDERLLCVVENPSDVALLDESTAYRGLYFVLMGHLSPLDGIGPAELGLEVLERRLASEPIEELILATSATVEGEATAHYLAEMARERGIRATRIAQGVPLGGELEQLDGGTLAHAFMGRRSL